MSTQKQRIRPGEPDTVIERELINGAIHTVPNFYNKSVKQDKIHKIYKIDKIYKEAKCLVLYKDTISFYMSNNSLMTSKEVAGYLKISERHLFRLRSEGKIRYYQDGRTVRFRQEDVEDFINSIEMPPFSTTKRGGSHD